MPITNVSESGGAIESESSGSDREVTLSTPGCFSWATDIGPDGRVKLAWRCSLAL